MEPRSIAQSPIPHHHRRNPKIAAAASIPIFPEEIFAEILTRIPVKSLLKFRCVSKSWRSLISSPHFVKAHLAVSRNSPNFSRHKIISTILQPYYTLKHCCLQSVLCGPSSDAVDLDYPMKSAVNSVRIVGCCNGLVCIAINGKHLFLWNPSTRKCKKLPQADDRMKRSFFITKYGFGYDESGEDYKVVGILFGFCSVGSGYETVMKIYSLKTNSWKRIEPFKEGLPFDDVGKFVSGNLHWGRRNGSNSRWEIVSLDLGSETSGKVAQPAYVEGGFVSSLGVLGDCLCVLCDFPKTIADVWVMKQYGVKESWEKVVSVPYIGDPWKGPYSAPLWIGLKGEILIIYGSTFVVYDPVHCQFKHPAITNFGTFLEADVYIESLVSLGPI